MKKSSRPKQPMQKLAQRLRKRFPNATIDLDAGTPAGGIWFLDVTIGKHTVSLQWQAGGKGFGITSTAEPGYGEGAHEVERRADAAFDRTVQLLLAGGHTRSPAPLGLGAVRRLQGVSQEQLAATLRIRQSSVSKLEQRGDLLLSSLRALVEGLGGRLHVRAAFPDGRSCLLDIPSSTKGPSTKGKR